MIERTVVLIKPDGVKRGLVGEILARFERVGLKIVALKIVWVDRELVGKHYADDERWYQTVGEKTLRSYEQYGYNPSEKLGTTDPIEVGRLVRKWSMESLSSGPVVAILLEGPHAVEIARKLIGATYPQVASPGTIRGDYSLESPILANTQKRSVKNLVHASGSVEEAKFEEALWFRQHEIYQYKRVGEGD